MLSSRGIYEIRFGNLKDARELITRALKISREYPLAKKGLAKLEQRL
jgi:Tfp pilus assembly protein PilF